ncbi:hypothetical protein BURMUCGD2M_1985 [Burkholderia multivorans CGD2M]|uniref:Uncharacterized protein n=1 Tax=Burkholderia multivorans CGD2 TaxID=513052 RepID=B9BM30_9BURK|nr:hypothetical protein BURMUCGD2_1899 [Burkholderia multivorans CGD2]EEE14372.1 hypothetical protein BURMUCGD2M_1985 [Burkholderia multivorans CGD2M]
MAGMLLCELPSGRVVRLDRRGARDRRRASLTSSIVKSPRNHDV